MTPAQDKKTILIVDDSPSDILFLSEFLQQDYTVLAATSGEKALKQVQQTPQPDVILLDVMMPEINGYEICRQLKEDPATQETDVIFVSAHDATDEKLAGYNAGGSDYLIKPVQPEELLQKVKLAIANRQIRDSQADEKNMAMQTAMTAMTSAGEQGVVLDFLQQCTQVNTLAELAAMIIDSISQYGLDSSVQIRSATGVINHGSRGAMTPLEHELLIRLNEQGRIMELDKLALFNFGLVSLFIKNMPEDEDRRGRLRDHIAILIQGAESRALALDMAQQSTQSISDLQQLVVESKQVLTAIITAQKSHTLVVHDIMDKMLEKLKVSAVSLGLTEKQQQGLVSVVQKGVDQSLSHLEKDLATDESTRKVFKRLATFEPKKRS